MSDSVYVFDGRFHALSVSGQCVTGANVSDAETTDDPACLPNQNNYRNYTDPSYSVCVDLVRTSVFNCPLVSSRVEKALTIVCNDDPCHLEVALYPQVSCHHHECFNGFYIALDPGLAGFFYLQLFRKETFGNKWHGIFFDWLPFLTPNQ